MAIRLLSAKRTGDDLAAGRVSAADQSLYLNASFLIWIIPAYLFLFPAPRTLDPEFFWTLWLVELAIVVLCCSVGIGYCLRNCRVDPARNFLVDFSCLNAPVSLTTLAVVWGAYYALEVALRVAGVESPPVVRRGTHARFGRRGRCGLPEDRPPHGSRVAAKEAKRFA